MSDAPLTAFQRMYELRMRALVNQLLEISREEKVNFLFAVTDGEQNVMTIDNKMEIPPTMKSYQWVLLTEVLRNGVETGMMRYLAFVANELAAKASGADQGPREFRP